MTLALSGEDGYFCLTTEEYDLMLLGRDTAEDRVLGLNSGADDYLVKPFAFPLTLPIMMKPLLR